MLAWELYARFAADRRKRQPILWAKAFDYIGFLVSE